MKASFETIPPPEYKSFHIRNYGKTGFEAPFHYHPELELTLIEEGAGTRFVGTHMDEYKSGDLVLIGPNVPHCWKLSNECRHASSIVIQFKSDLLGKEFLSKPEIQPISNLIRNCQGAMVLHGLLRQHITSNMLRLLKVQDPFESTIGLLNILHTIALSTEIENIYTLPEKSSLRSGAEEDRILDVYNYIQDNFRKGIELSEASRIAGMTPNGFCKYFKRLTRKTFLEVVTDYRIDFATQLLIKTGHTITEISYECGYDDVSHFYKTFRKRMHTSPLAYRKKFREQISKI